MTIDETKHGAVTVVRPIGAVTGGDADDLKRTLLEARTRSLGRLVLDASAISFIDSRGLEVLVEVSEEMAGSGQSLKTCGLNELLREILELTDLASALERFDDANAAVRSFI